jgi:hypothetical protein
MIQLINSQLVLVLNKRYCQLFNITQIEKSDIKQKVFAHLAVWSKNLGDFSKCYKAAIRDKFLKLHLVWFDSFKAVTSKLLPMRSVRHMVSFELVMSNSLFFFVNCLFVSTQAL